VRTAVLFASLTLILLATPPALDAQSKDRLADRGQPAGATAVLGAPTGVPIQVVGNLIVVHATVNGAVRAMLIVDAGARVTVVTPLLLARLGQPVPPHARRREVPVVGGGKRDVPFVTIGAVQVGDARVEGLEVGVYEPFPEAPEIEGILGADFLQRFRVTLDKDQRRMILAPLSP
jgi:hypothetical protein